jgi:hypothetical protein
MRARRWHVRRALRQPCEFLVIVTTWRASGCRLRRMPDRSVVLVAGSGRSGTSLFAGIMQRLGYTVPGPEVPADETNPRGFAESQWVVAFHTRLLRRAGVQVADARPSAWAQTARIGLDEAVAAELRRWLAEQLSLNGHLIVKDPRISWFAPLWRRCAGELGAAPRFVTMLRHPAAVIDSKQRWYGGRQGEISRAAGWLNQTLFTERATRESPRAFVRYDDLLEDWTHAVSRAVGTLGLDALRTASPQAMRAVHEFVDQGLRRSQGDWDRLALPGPLRAQAEEAWQLVTRLGGEDDAETCARLDDLRVAYTDLYAGAEAFAHSSIVAARAGAPAPNGRLPAPATWLIRRVPAHYKRRVPPRVRARVIRSLKRSGRAVNHA